MILLIVKQIIKSKDMMLISFDVMHLQSYILWMVEEFVRLLF